MYSLFFYFVKRCDIWIYTTLYLVLSYSVLMIVEVLFIDFIKKNFNFLLVLFFWIPTSGSGVV